MKGGVVLTDTTKLRNKITSKGLKYYFVAESIDMPRGTFYKKMNNELVFKADEIMAITKLLQLTKKERDEIFFAEKSE